LGIGGKRRGCADEGLKKLPYSEKERKEELSPEQKNPPNVSSVGCALDTRRRYSSGGKQKKPIKIRYSKKRSMGTPRTG